MHEAHMDTRTVVFKPPPWEARNGWEGSASSPQTPNIFVISWELVGKECTFPAALGGGARFMGCDGERGRGPLGVQEARLSFQGGTCLCGGKPASLHPN